MKTTKFDLKELIKDFKNLIPEGYPQRKLQTGIINIETKWRWGAVTKLTVDEIDLTNKIIDKQEILEKILKESGRFKNKFSGTLKFDIRIEEGMVVRPGFSMRNFFTDPKVKNYVKW